MKTKKPSGGAALMSSGKIPVLLGLRPDEAELIRAAAATEHRPVTQFLTHHGLLAAEKILKNSQKSAWLLL